MGAEVVWLDQAKDDLRELLDYLAERNPAAATKYVAGIADACGRLSDFPLSGLQYNERYRRIVFRNHLVFYRLDEQNRQVLIATVLDGRRDIEKLLDTK
jgi:plasmid stabilization system protein ParE